MKNNSAKRLEIFLWLALRRSANGKIAAETEPAISENDALFGLLEQLSETNKAKFRNILADYQNKSASEKENWQKRTQNFIAADTPLVDENVHWTHIAESLRKETPAIRQMLFDFLPQTDKIHLQSFFINQNEADSVNKQLTLSEQRNNNFQLIEKAVRNGFAKQFAALHDLDEITALDRLDSAQLVRLARFTAIREIAFACARIEAVESVAAFLRRFPAEDARAIAVQLNNLPETSNARLSFAENLVQKSFEIEPQSSAMLDLLGIWLIGIRLCESPANCIAYTKQKLPIEFAPELAEIIETQSRQTPTDLQRTIGAEIEYLAETIMKMSKNGRERIAL